MTAAVSTERLGGPATLNRGARATRAKRSLADFARQAVEAGEIEGTRSIEWGPHLDAHCGAVQLQLEAWLVAYGLGTPDMIARQREAWEREWPVTVKNPDGSERIEMQRPTWEDGLPNPWERYVLVQNELDNLPPGTWKSTVALVIANAWIWLWCPWFAFGASSGTDANVKRDSLATRALVRSSWYRETFEIAWADHDVDPDLDEFDEETGITIRHDENSVSDWATTAGGRRISRTVGRGFTGVHVDGLYFDDPDDADRVYNESDRLRPQNRWTRAMETRVNCEHRSLRRVLQQRLYILDFSAYLLGIARWTPRNPKGWSQLCIPARFGFGPADVPTETPYGWRDWRKLAGELIHPRITAGVLADKMIKLGSAALAAQYDQNPKRLGDAMFARRHARFFLLEDDRMPTRARPDGFLSRTEAPPSVVRIEDLTRLTLSVDTSNSRKKPGDLGDQSKRSAVGLGVIGCRDEERLVLEDRTRVLGPSETYRAIFEIMHAWMLDCVLVEAKALGEGTIEEIERSIRRGWYLNERDEQVPLRGPDGEPVRCVVEPFNPGKDDKVQRAHGMLPQWEQGLILLRDGADWLYPRADESSRKTLDEGLLEEICTFPAAAKNDRVDYLSQVVAHYRGKTDTRSRWKAMGRLGILAGRR